MARQEQGAPVATGGNGIRLGLRDQPFRKQRAAQFQQRSGRIDPSEQRGDRRRRRKRQNEPGSNNSGASGTGGSSGALSSPGGGGTAGANGNQGGDGGMGGTGTASTYGISLVNSSGANTISNDGTLIIGSVAIGGKGGDGGDALPGGTGGDGGTGGSGLAAMNGSFSGYTGGSLSASGSTFAYGGSHGGWHGVHRRDGRFCPGKRLRLRVGPGERRQAGAGETGIISGSAGGNMDRRRGGRRGWRRRRGRSGRLRRGGRPVGRDRVWY